MILGICTPSRFAVEKLVRDLDEEVKLAAREEALEDDVQILPAPSPQGPHGAVIPAHLSPPEPRLKTHTSPEDSSRQRTLPVDLKYEEDWVQYLHF